MKRGLERRKISFTDDLSSVDFNFDVLFIAVGTPATLDGDADLAAFMSAIDAIAPRLQQFTVIAVKSTVPVGTGAMISRRIRALNPSGTLVLPVS